MSDSSQTDIDHNPCFPNVATNASSPYYLPRLKNISDRVKTPVRLQNRMSSTIETLNGSF